MHHKAIMNRRQFVQLGTLTTAAVAMLPHTAQAAEFILPKLPYSFSALEPHIDAKTMEIHHGKHHATYVAGLNAALASAPQLAKKPLENILSDLPAVADEPTRNALRNHGGGHWNHKMFWEIMCPASESGKPSAQLSAAITSAFGSLDAMKLKFNEAATKRFGSGWAWLVYADGKLKITSTPNQDNPLMKGIVPDANLGIPLLGLDVWEHAYYLNYQNRRVDYISAWWNIVNWSAVSEAFEKLTK
jgi:Fe-Mn family superoxide dismutase